MPDCDCIYCALGDKWLCVMPRRVCADCGDEMPPDRNRIRCALCQLRKYPPAWKPAQAKRGKAKR